MGIADRDYHRNPPPPASGLLGRVTPVVKGLLILNVAIFILDMALAERDGGLPPIFAWGAFTIGSGVLELRLWEFLTFQFLHGSLGHVLFNSLGLYFFGPWLERWWGSSRFTIYYLLCGAAGAVFYTLLSLVGLLPWSLDTPLIGASAGIYGIFIGVAVIAPNMRVALLFPPIELSMRQLALALMAFAVLVIIFKITDNDGGEAGHLGGAILGYFLMKYPRLLGRGGFPRVTRSNHPPAPSKLRPRSHLATTNPEVDRILDKISREGFQSLTNEERATLLEASKHPHQP